MSCVSRACRYRYCCHVSPIVISVLVSPSASQPAPRPDSQLIYWSCLCWLHCVGLAVAVDKHLFILWLWSSARIKVVLSHLKSQQKIYPRARSHPNFPYLLQYTILYSYATYSIRTFYPACYIWRARCNASCCFVSSWGSYPNRLLPHRSVG